MEFRKIFEATKKPIITLIFVEIVMLLAMEIFGNIFAQSIKMSELLKSGPIQNIFVVITIFATLYTWFNRTEKLRQDLLSAGVSVILTVGVLLTFNMLLLFMVAPRIISDYGYELGVSIIILISGSLLLIIILETIIELMLKKYWV